MAKNQSMDPRVKKIIVEALRSGEYPQTRQALKSERGYCCLGVACNEYNKEIQPEVDWVPDDKYYDPDLCRSVLSYAYMGEASILPEAVADWMKIKYLGVQSLMGTYKTKEGTVSSLMQLNDSGATFDQIADVIEEYF